MIHQQNDRPLINFDYIKFITNNTDAGIVCYSAIRDQENQIMDFRYELLNDIAIKVILHLNKDFIGKRMTDFYKKEEMTWFDTFVEVVETGITKNIILSFTIGNNTRWFRDKIVKMGDGLIVYFYDETEKLRISKELASKNQMLQDLLQKKEGIFSQILNQAFDGVFYIVPIMNSKGEIVDFHNVFANDASLRILKLTREQIYPFTFLQIFPEAKNTGNFQLYCDCYKSGEPRQKLFHYDMEWIKGWFRFDCFRYTDGVMIYIKDETLIKEHEEQIEKQNQALKNLLRQKEILLHETHHRVKNNMQIIASLLSLQSRNIPDPNVHEIFEISTQRIQTMAFIHETLYGQSDFEKMQLEKFIMDVIGSIRGFYSQNKDIIFNFDIQDINLPISICVNLGLIFNELISNSVKHAFKGLPKGEINISSKVQDNKLIIIIQDNGKGVSNDFDIDNLSSLGLKIVSLLVDQMDGNLLIKNHMGLAFNITLPLIQ